jgi:hypothetical protein
MTTIDGNKTRSIFTRFSRSIAEKRPTKNGRGHEWIVIATESFDIELCIDLDAVAKQLAGRAGHSIRNTSKSMHGAIVAKAFNRVRRAP